MTSVQFVRRLSAAVAAVLAGTLVLTACSGGAAPDAESGGEPVSGGELTVAVRSEPPQLNPLVDQTGGAHVLSPVVDSLVWDNGDGTYAPWLATEWEVSDDATEYTFTLREDVTFHDGTPFDAEAVKTNIDYVADPANKSTGSVAKLGPSAEVVDDYTVTITLDSPESTFLTLIAAPYFGIVSPVQLTEDPDSLASSVIGTGPFVFDSWVKGQSLTYTRNDDYNWGPEGTHAGAAYLDSMKYLFLPEDQTRYNALVTGEADVVDYIAPEYAEQVAADQDHDSEEFLLPGVGYTLYLNTRQAPFDDVTVRQALLHGLDREGIVEAATFGAYPVQEYLATTTPDYKEDLENTITFDVDEAGRLLDEAGWTETDAEGFRVKDGERLATTIPYADDDQLAQRTLEQVQIDAKALGFDVELQPVPASDFSQRLYNGDYGIMASFQSEATGMQLWRLYGGDNVSDGSSIGSNASFLADPELDGILAKARSSADPTQRAEYYGQAQELLPELAPSVPLFSRARLVSWQSNVNGLSWDNAWPQPYLFDVWKS
ncbi:ABC transporter substrate-binding protein [Mycetocola reblochoni]|uniref:Oligopeptide ABC transporter, periplasmic oligopeptide-binding protein OppA (TC 3.A.1.5.1) n=1 Tax=Mycetocola reblochoni REB411 TaxID=1255698 RepID=A0A1R4IXI6_9MICO|nr:ABC transporter substrate-binding protein [Mycetocola reblochoni]SJN24582.1 Oligopeptide ABC transporter, periplasmic oligopeptide-binding protein OppA (TC 3.A.1.5.1) [Mycetocola reblochoni REB411]